MYVRRMPRYVHLREFWPTILAGVVFAILLGVTKVISDRVAPAQQIVWMYALGFLFILCLWAHARWVMKRRDKIREHVLLADRRICPQCGYALNIAETQSVVCPKCATPHTTGSLRDAWSWFLRLPPYVARKQDAILSHWIGMLPIVIAFLCFSGSFTLPTYWLLSIIIGIELIVYMFWIRWRLGVRRRVEQTHRRLCPWCLYDLRGMADHEGICPECGKPYTVRSLEEAWQYFMRSAI